jgi:hypothetical protein
VKTVLKVLLTIVGCAAAVPVGLALVLVSSCWISRATKVDRPFVASDWQAAHLHLNKELRFEMLGDLLRNHMLVGRRVEDVEAKLGSERNHRAFGPSHLAYYLGGSPCCGIDSQWLVLRIRDGIVVSHERSCD